MDPGECCPKFDPAPWENQEIVWDNKLFVVDRIASFFHIPLNAMKKIPVLIKKLDEAGAAVEPMLMLWDENSLWGADIYTAAQKEVPPYKSVRLSGAYLTKVFEGPYKDAGKWAKEMMSFAESKGKTAEKLYFWYTTCPACAKKHGANFVVLFAKVG
jgi:hypothetical protein